MSAQPQQQDEQAAKRERMRLVLTAMAELLEKDPKFAEFSKEEQMKRAGEYVDAKKEELTATVEKKQQEQQQEQQNSKPKKEKKEKEEPKRDPNDPNLFPLAGKGKLRQTWPEPTIPVNRQFDGRKYPPGEIKPHPGELNAFRLTSEEKKALERAPAFEQKIFDLRQAAEVHRQVRTYAQHTLIKPGVTLMSIADGIEKKLEELIVKQKLNRGQAFPTGVNLNHVAAHYTCNTGDKTVLSEGDVMKVDFGTQVNGWIIDCAWTWHKDPVYDPLVEATKAATNKGLQLAGIDARLSEIGEAIQEVIESYECTLPSGKVVKVKPIKNLSGHSIDRHKIHAGKSVPLVKSPEMKDKMEEYEEYAIETFASTGKGMISNDMSEQSHFMANYQALGDPWEKAKTLRSDSARSLAKHIESYFGTLAFCRKWLDRQGQEKHMLGLKQLVDHGVVQTYPALVDVKGCMTSQSEHTLIMKPSAVEVLSRGEDY